MGVLLGLTLVLGPVFLISACGGDDDNSSKSTSSSGKATATHASSGEGDKTPAGQATSGNDGDDGGSSSGNSSGSGDLDKLADKLVPPHSKQIAKYSTDDGLLITYESTDSVDSLKDFYDDKVKNLGVKVQGTFDAGDSHTWYFGDDDSSGPGGTVIVGDNGGGKTSVTITIGKN